MSTRADYLDHSGASFITPAHCQSPISTPGLQGYHQRPCTMWTVKQFCLASTRPTPHTQWGAGMVCGPNGVSNALWGLPGPASWLYKLGHSSKSSLWYPEGVGALIPLYTLQLACWQCSPAYLSVLRLVCTISPGVWSSGLNPHTQGTSQTSKK